MKIHICNDNKVFPFFYVDDFYTPEEEKLIWRELDFYTDRPNAPLFHRAEEDKRTGRYRDGTAQSKGWRIYLNNLYQIQNVSHILRLQPLKIQSEEIRKAIHQTGPNFRMLQLTSFDEMVISYYENDDYYKPHIDHFMISIFCWFHRSPKAYSGGDITLTDTNTTIECKHNRMLMFPSYYPHEVHPIKMENRKIGYGRYALINFCGLANVRQTNYLNLGWGPAGGKK
tara:strand:+ start:97 stop:777 length:681 start_codon:yes stop_codon:yes gene_type:complete